MATTGTMRLAIRREGADINAYLAKSTGMDGALLIGHIATAAAQLDPNLFEGFKALMVATMAVLMKDQGLTVIGTEERDAPEGERAGHA
jgi:hypothetical protein